MLKKKMYSGIPMNLFRFQSTMRDICDVCDNTMTINDKYIILDNLGEPNLYYCRFCRTIYNYDDELVYPNTKDCNDNVGLS